MEETKKKSKKGWIIFAVIFGLALLVGAVSYFVYQAKKKAVIEQLMVFIQRDKSVKTTLADLEKLTLAQLQKMLDLFNKNPNAAVGTVLTVSGRGN